MLILLQVIQLTEDLLRDAQQQQPDAPAPKTRRMPQLCSCPLSPTPKPQTPLQHVYLM